MNVLPVEPTLELINRIKKAEGFVAKPYWDRTQWTYGYGCKAPSKHSRITEPQASALLCVRLEQSCKEFFSVFLGHLDKFNEVRQECFIDMLFNLGKAGVLGFTNTLKLIKANDVVPWDKVAHNLSLSLWYRQVGNRAKRICTEVSSGAYA